LKTLNTLFQRDLAQLAIEIDAYRSESNLWVVDKDITNCAGNLCLHLVGNLNAYIGATLGGSGYIRQRELEFSEKNVPKTELLRRIKETAAILDKTLKKLKEEDMNKEFPLIVFKEKMTTGFFLIHLSTHLTYHLGQINYHRRLLDL
ncbi:MAG: DinB family protein, partial [Flavobacteriaceae bacterium]